VPRGALLQLAQRRAFFPRRQVGARRSQNAVEMQQAVSWLKYRH
jgi:hypothetical protein